MYLGHKSTIRYRYVLTQGTGKRNMKCGGWTLGLKERAADNMSVFFEMAPKSWLHVFIRTLPKESRLALFKTSRQLARLVVQSAGTISYTPKDVPKAFMCIPQTVMEAIGRRRDAITSLLNEGSLHVESVNAVPHFITLQHRVTSLHLCGWKNSALEILDWPALFPNLRALELDVPDDDLHAVSNGIEAGHLRQLCSIKLNTHVELFSRSAPGTYIRLLDALGPQINELECDCDVWKHVKLPQFPNLQCLKLKGCQLTSDSIQAICEHPTLQSLSLSLMQASTALKRPALRPSWKVLDVRYTAWTILAAFPLHNVQRIVVHRALASESVAERAALTEILALYASRLVCPPTHTNVFDVKALNACTPQLLRCLQPSCQVLSLSAPVAEPHLLAALWAALPPFVHTIRCSIRHDIPLQTLWQGLPLTVTSVELTGVHGLDTAASFEHVCNMAPPHIRTLANPKYSWVRGSQPQCRVHR